MTPPDLPVNDPSDRDIPAASIPRELQALVYKATRILGVGIREEFGEAMFQRVEGVRRRMKSIRSAEYEETLAVLRREAERLRGEGDAELRQLAHSFALMLELTNRCESAYRTYRIRLKGRREFQHKPHAAIFVFTAHPTEARSPEILFLFQKVAELLEESLLFGFEPYEEELAYLLRLCLKVPMSRERKPTVRDEAEYLYSYVLRKEILDQQVAFSRQGVPVGFRSWVGGDKDGHPDVDEKTLIMSLELSRARLLDWLGEKLAEATAELALLGEQAEGLEQVERGMRELGRITAGDGAQVAAWKERLLGALDALEARAGVKVPVLEQIRQLLWIYPALVLPLEVREDAELVREAEGVVEKGEQALSFSVVRMLDAVREISEGMDPKWYVRSLILSMVMDVADVRAGHQLIVAQLGGYRIPVVPLFENAHALENAVPILEAFLGAEGEGGEPAGAAAETDSPAATHQERWGGRFEVMLGYSDSSKESGVLPSRFLIYGAMKKLDAFFRRKGLTPVYFHGSGGSIERGGGSIREQTQWWPHSAVAIFKATVQGEMVARNFGSSEVMRSQIEKIMDELSVERQPASATRVKAVRQFSDRVQEHYQAMISTDEFFDVVLQATPYNYLDVLRIGSRPTKRQTSSRRLRAIPWVLCWTQTRVLLPTWWGVGSAFESLTTDQRIELRQVYLKGQLLSSFMKIFGFTLRKVELPIWRLYLERLGLPEEQVERHFEAFKAEYARCLAFFHYMTGESNLLWHRPWLGESIYFRSSMIHPLNLIQIEALRRENETLLRETVTGIACGMMTTG